MYITFCDGDWKKVLTPIHAFSHGDIDLQYEVEMAMCWLVLALFIVKLFCIVVAHQMNHDLIVQLTLNEIAGTGQRNSLDRKVVTLQE